MGRPGRAAPCRPKPGSPEAGRPAPHLAARGRSRNAASRWWRRAAVARSGRGGPRTPRVGRAAALSPGRRGAVLHPHRRPPADPPSLQCFLASLHGRRGPIPRAPVGPVHCANPGLGTWWCKNKGQASGCGRAETCPAPPSRGLKGTKGIPRARGPRRRGRPRSLPERQGL